MAGANCVGDIGKFRGILSKAKNIVVLTGAGTSAESGVPTFRGAGGFWRTYQSQDLATYGAFKRSPSLVWEFYHYRRELCLTKEPNKTHFSIAKAESELEKVGRNLTVITQNVDGLHQRAGSKKVIELHGSLYKTKCLSCGNIEQNFDSPICTALKGMGAPDNQSSPKIPEEELPRCKKVTCKGLLRPHIVWFGENLHEDIMDAADAALATCDACLVVGTSSVVYPAAMYAPALAQKNVPVAEFNIESTPATHQFQTYNVVKASINDKNELKNQSQGAVKTSKTTSDGSGSGIGDSGRGSKDDDKPGKLSMKEKLKLFMRDYGSTVIVFHIGISLVFLGVIYGALSSGLDMTWLVDLLGVSGKSGDIATGASTFVIAYAINKVLAPVRFSVTFACTPFIVRYLRKIGILKQPKPKM